MMNNKLKVIDLLNKIANGEEVPIKIKYNYITWEWNEKQKDYIELNGATRNLFTYYLDNLTECLNNGIEIIEEEKKMELPEKLEIEQDTPNSNYYIKNEFGTKCSLTKHSKMIADKLNETLDYLKYKEEEKEK